MTTTADELSQGRKREVDPWRPLRDRAEVVWGTVWSFIHGLLPLAMLIVGGYFIDKNRNPTLGVFLIAGVTWWLIQQSMEAYALGRPLEVFAAQRCSTILTVRFSVEKVLGHQSVRNAFSRLQAKGRVPEETRFDDWRASLLSWHRQHQEIPAEEPAVEHAEFHFQSGRLRVNGKTQRLPLMDYEILVAPVEGKFASKGISEGLARMVRIRVNVLNGILRLQVGEWNEEIGYKEKDQEYSWMAWDTIATFPLVLDPVDHFIPPQYLLMEYFSGTPMHRPRWGALKREWQRQDIDYRKVLNTWGEYGQERTYRRMQNKFAAWMEREGFKEVGSSWRNQYMAVEFNCFQDRATMHRWLQDTKEPLY